VKARARELHAAARDAWEEVRQAKAIDAPTPFISLTSGEDLSYVIEAARLWRKLADEMVRTDAPTVGDLGPDRVAHWQRRLAPLSLDPPLSGAQPPDPLIRRVDTSPRPPFRPPSAGRDRDGDA
jgi:hypothetical protein